MKPALIGRDSISPSIEFSLCEIRIFVVFFVKANKGGYSSHLLQSRILKNVLESDLPPI